MYGTVSLLPSKLASILVLILIYLGYIALNGGLISNHESFRTDAGPRKLASRNGNRLLSV